MLGYLGGKAYGRQCLVKQSWEMGEICPKTKSYPPLIKQKLISTHPHIMTILRLPPPPPYKKFPPIDSLITSLLVGFPPLVQTSLQMTLQRTSKSHLKSHQNHWTLGLCRLCMNWEIPHLLQRSLRLPRAWVRTRSINSALLPLKTFLL